MREGDWVVGRLLYSALLPTDETGEVVYEATQINRLLLEVERATSGNESPPELLRLAYFQRSLPFDPEQRATSHLSLFADPASGEWLVLRVRGEGLNNTFELPRVSFYGFETAGWWSGWFKNPKGSLPGAEDLRSQLEETVPHLLRLLRELPLHLPEERRVYPNFFAIDREWIAKLLGWPETNGPAARTYRLVESRNVRADQVGEGLAAEWRDLFGRWGKGMELLVKVPERR